MITEILIGIGCFICGAFVGTVITLNKIIKVNNLYSRVTGNNFVEWIFDTANEVRKAEARGEKPVLDIQIKDED